MAKIPKMDNISGGVSSDLPYRDVDMSGSRRALSQAAEGMNKIGQGLDVIGVAFEKAVETRRKINQSNDFANMIVDFENTFRAAESDYRRTNPDPNEYMPEMKRQYDAIVQATMKQTDYPEVQRAFRERMAGRQLTILDESQRYADNIWKDKMLADSFGQIDELKKLAATADTEGNFQELTGLITGKIRGMAGTVMDADKAKLLELHTMDDLKKQRDKHFTDLARSEILSTPDGPNNVISILDKYGVKDENRGLLMREAEVESGRRFRMDQEQQYRVDRDASSFFFNKLNLPGFAEQNGGPLTPTEISNSGLSFPRKQEFLQILKNSVRPGKTATDINFATGLMDSILSGNLRGVHDTIMRETAKDPNSVDNPPRLGLGEAQELLRLYWAKAEGQKQHYTNDPWFVITRQNFASKLGIQEEENLDTTINRAFQGGIKPPKKNMEYYYEATKDLMRTVESRGLKGEAIAKAGDAIISVYMAKIAQDQRAKQPPTPGARQAADGNWYINDPQRKGKFLRVD